MRNERRGTSLSERLHGTTILAVRLQDKIAMGGDGQVTLGETAIKHGAVKVRRIHEGRVLAGFAGGAADGLTLLDTFEAKLDQHGGHVRRAAIELAKAWRTDRMLRRLEAQLAVGGDGHLILISGNGDVLEPDDGLLALGSGGPYALAAARALTSHTDLSVVEIVETSLKIASQICVYTNEHIVVEELSAESQSM